MRLLSIDQDLAKNSYYAATAPRDRRYAPLTSAERCDVAVVGGGLAGLSAAIELAGKGLSVVLLEARQLGWGASGRNGGQAIHGLACDQSVIEAQLGLAQAKRVWDMSIEAIRLIGERRARFGIECDWRDGYLGLAVSPRKGRELAEWADRIDTVYGYPLRRIAAGETRQWIASTRYHSGIHDPQGGHLHPLKFTLGLARAAQALGVRLYEDSPVTELVQGAEPRLRAGSGEVRARHVLLAGNVYLQGLVPRLEARIMPVGTYIIATEKLDPAVANSLVPSRAAVCDSNFVLDYFRTTNDDRMLYGGRVSYSTVTPPNLADSMRQRMAQTFPQLAKSKVEFAWGGFVDISMNRAPDFGRLPAAPGQPANVYYLQGFSGHGLALTGLAGKLVAEAIVGDASRFDVFSKIAHRPFPGGRLLRTPALVLGMAWYRLRDALG